MSRNITRPADTVREEIRRIDEVPATPTQPGFVRVLVGVLNEAGEFVVPQQFVSHTIEGENYAALIGPPTDANPDKPAGTYRNDDLWPHIETAKEEVKARVDKAKAAQAAVERARQDKIAADAAQAVKDKQNGKPQNPV